MFQEVFTIMKDGAKMSSLSHVFLYQVCFFSFKVYFHLYCNLQELNFAFFATLNLYMRFTQCGTKIADITNENLVEKTTKLKKKNDCIHPEGGGGGIPSENDGGAHRTF